MGKIWKRESTFVFETSGSYKFLILRPGGFYFSNYAPRVLEKGADGFSMYLRKHFSGKFLENIVQINGDRIVQLFFSHCELSLIAELFGRGNVIAVDSQNEIQSALAARSWGSREIKKGLIYEPPKFKNWFLMTSEELSQELSGLNKSEASRKLGLGKEIEDVYDDDSQKLIHNLEARLNIPLAMETVEKMFKEVDSNLISEAEEKINSQIEALEKSKNETEALLESYRQTAKALRKLGTAIFMDLETWDKRLKTAPLDGKKRLKVSTE